MYRNNNVMKNIWIKFSREDQTPKDIFVYEKKRYSYIGIN